MQLEIMMNICILSSIIQGLFVFIYCTGLFVFIAQSL